MAINRMVSDGADKNQTQRRSFGFSYSSRASISQFLDKKEGNRLVAYPDRKNIWTICGGATRVDGKPVAKG